MTMRAIHACPPQFHGQLQTQAEKLRNGIPQISHVRNLEVLHRKTMLHGVNVKAGPLTIEPVHSLPTNNGATIAGVVGTRIAPVRPIGSPRSTAQEHQRCTGYPDLAHQACHPRHLRVASR